MNRLIHREMTKRKKRPLRSPEGMRLRLQGIFSCPQRTPRTVRIVSLHLFSILKKFMTFQPEPSTIVEMNPKLLYLPWKLYVSAKID